jgi:hypothetical protein
LEIIERPTPEAFAAAFTKDVVLDASVLPRSMTGATDVRAFFGATRAMFDAIAFKHEVTWNREPISSGKGRSRATTSLA